MKGMNISSLARQAGVGIDTVRYYERTGLIPEPPRRSSGYRDYPLEMVARLRFIRRAKELGFSLEEIGELLSLSGQRGQGVTGGVKSVKAAAESKLRLVEEKLRELKRIRAGLQTLIAACPGHGTLEACPILNALNSGDTP
jgi:MerR family copper efflux transcriptional regulator